MLQLINPTLDQVEDMYPNFRITGQPDYKNLGEFIYVYSQLYTNGSVKAIVTDDGIFLGLVGLHRHDSQADIYLIVTSQIEKYALAFHKLMCQHLNLAAQEYGPFDLYCAYVKEIYMQGRKWIKMLGFEEQDRLENFYNNENYIRYIKYVR